MLLTMLAVLASALVAFCTVGSLPGAEARRVARGSAGGSARLLVWSIFWFVALFQPMALVLSGKMPEFSPVPVPSLFWLHAFGLFAVGCDAVLRRGRKGLFEHWRVEASELGLRAASWRREIGVGMVAGVALWFLTLFSLAVVAGLLGGGPEEGPPMVLWLAALPAVWRVSLALSAGFCEELLFRGFLQPRIGPLFSSLLFVGVHVSYDAPWMLFGVALLSAGFATLRARSGSIWSAVCAHAVFDSIQLLIVLPRLLGSSLTGDV